MLECRRVYKGCLGKAFSIEILRLSGYHERLQQAKGLLEQRDGLLAQFWEVGLIGKLPG